MTKPPAGQTSLHAHRERSGAKAAIVFVHGFLGDIDATWGPFPEFVIQQPTLQSWDVWMLGYPTHLNIDILGIWSGDPGLDHVALRLATDARVGALERYDALALVAHSMGGLVVQRALIDHAALRKKVRKVVVFGTPSGGLFKAGLGRWLKPQLRHMAQEGPFIRALRADWDSSFGARMPFDFMAVAGERDEFVPSSSSLGPFRRPDGSSDHLAVVPGNHVQMVKPERSDALCVRLLTHVVVGDADPEGPRNSAKVAVELGEFQAAVDQLLPKAAELDHPTLVQLAIALDGLGRRDEAIALLRDRPRGLSDTDAMGTLGGRYKRRWLGERRQADGEAALALYRQAWALAEQADDPAQAYYQGINVAFLELAFLGDPTAARVTAERVLEHCKAASQRDEATEARRWRLATQAEAQLVLGASSEAIELYREAVSTGQPQPWQLASTYQQAAWLVQKMEDAALLQQLQAVFMSGATS